MNIGGHLSERVLDIYKNKPSNLHKYGISLAIYRDFKKFRLFVWFLNVLVNYKVISRTGPKTKRLTILRAATHQTELGNHDFLLSRSHADTDPTSRERAVTAGIEPETSSPGVARSTD